MSQRPGQVVKLPKGKDMIQKTTDPSMALNQLGLDLDSAYESLFQALAKKHSAQASMSNNSDLYDAQLHALVLEGIPGKNMQERDAYIAVALMDTVQAAARKRDDVSGACLTVKRAEIEVERLRAQLRILEALVKVTP